MPRARVARSPNFQINDQGRTGKWRVGLDQLSSQMIGTELQQYNIQFSEFIQQFHHDPLGFVLAAYPWGEPGTMLEKYEGPDAWQREFLKDLGEEVRKRRFDGKNPVAPIRMAVASGHGTGKSVLV